jgi:Domain of unknown function (DUF1841)
MTIFDSYSRDQLRQTYADAWRKQGAGAPLSPLEALISDVIGVHPEYHVLIENADARIAFEANPAGGSENPFLHMGLHLAIREQVSIDRPPGIRDLHARLRLKYGDLHRAEHLLMEALGETLWQAQRSGRPPDETLYLTLARRQLEG